MRNGSATPHGRGVRGITLPRSSMFFEGNFGRLFRALPPAEFGDDDKSTLANLNALAVLMKGPDDTAKDGADPEESGIPALYTYFGQFVDHDLTFDPSTSLQQQNDADGLVDFRTPRFDLDNIYGRGPSDQPYLYLNEAGKKSPKLLLGSPLTGGTVRDQADLPRNNSTPSRAIIGDPRNDENTIVAQLQTLFYRFHNRMVDDNPLLPFEAIQKKVRFHYQWILINDFLPTLINPTTYSRIFPHHQRHDSIADAPPVLRFYRARNAAFMPLEFSVAAYRFGHSMVRPGYRLNDDVILPIFGGENAPGRPASLRGFMPPNADWAIDWARFIDIEERENGVKVDDDGNVVGTGRPPSPEEIAIRKRRLQLAYRIDTSVVKPLSSLPPDVADQIIISLIERNLVRGWRLRLPNGQDVARAMGFVPLKKIRIGKFEDGAEPGQFVDLNENTNSDLQSFIQNCPLWVYILAETFEHRLPGKFGTASHVLGEVGGTIVGESFAGLLMYDSHSFFNQDPRWRPQISGGKFGIKEFVKYALGM